MLNPRDPFGINNPASWGLDKLKIQTREEANVPRKNLDGTITLAEKKSIVLVLHINQYKSGFDGTLFVAFEARCGKSMIASGPKSAVVKYLRSEGYTILTKTN